MSASTHINTTTTVSNSVPDRLTVSGLGKRFGQLVVADDIHLALPPGARTALIGPNGAGKSTFVNLVTGQLKASTGRILLDGDDITVLSPAERVRRGLVRSFQVTRLFRELTVADNVRLAVLQQRRQYLRWFRPVAKVPELDREVTRVLADLNIEDRAGTLVRNLAYGEQRLIEIALVLALKPRVLMLDEPAAGVPQSESGIILDAVANLPVDLAVLIIEHDMDLVFRFARDIAVLVNGAVIATGSPREIAVNETVKNIYLGKRA